MSITHPAAPQLLDDLTWTYRDRLTDAEIERVVEEVWRALSKPDRFDTYLPVLVARIADDQLRLLVKAPSPRPSHLSLSAASD